MFPPVQSIAFFLGVLFLQRSASDDSSPKQQQQVYNIGVGIADVTGPAAQVNMMGYAQMSQTVGGIHLRLFSRAFIIGDGGERVVFVSVDAGMISQLVRMQVMKKLKESYGYLYTDANVCLSSTHTHSGPAGFFQYLLYDIMSLGYIQESMEALVQGIVLSIQRAHNNVQQGYIYYNEGQLLGASINRSPVSYLQNPSEERARYAYDVDKQMLLLKMTDLKGNPIGMINWFAVHGVSMNNTNKLISSDNKGYASILFEQAMEPNVLPGKTKFVGAFAQSNEGDVTPNTRGPHCLDTGEPCDNYTSTCNGKAELCVASGPGIDMFDSTSIIAHLQTDKAMELFKSADKPLVGSVKFIHQYVNMADMSVTVNDTHTVKTCKAALGHSFAAGTIDGPGAFDFKQHIIFGKEEPFWDVVRDVIKNPSKELKECHKPKPILLATGEMTMPYMWTPEIVDTQILQVGQLVIVPVPGEFTTMSGRRLRDAVKEAITSTSNEIAASDLQVVIAGLSNVYTNYITTFEEYQFQRYEGASTLYGPHTLSAYIQQYVYLAKNIDQRQEVSPGPSPPDLLSKQITLLPGVLFDSTPIGFHFGDVFKDASASYKQGSTVEVAFACANPRNNAQLEGTFLSVEHLDDNSGNWNVLATDSNWETRFNWRYLNSLLGQSICTISWDIPTNAVEGQYRIRHTGYKKCFISGLKPYEGYSRIFTVSK